MPQSRTTNPFYPLVVIAGIAFCITACAYGVMTVRELRQTSPMAETDTAESFGRLLDRHGLTVMMGELALLGVFSIGAMGSDNYWERRKARLSGQSPKVEEDESTQPPSSNRSEE